MASYLAVTGEFKDSKTGLRVFGNIEAPAFDAETRPTIKTTTVFELTDNREYTEPCWSSDAKTLAFGHTRTPELHLVSFATPSSPKHTVVSLFTPANSQEVITNMRWTSDSTRLVVTCRRRTPETPTIFIYTRAGEPVTTLATAPTPDAFAWLNTHAAYLETPTKLVVVDTHTWATVATAKVLPGTRLCAPDRAHDPSMLALTCNKTANNGALMQIFTRSVLVTHRGGEALPPRRALAAHGTASPAESMVVYWSPNASSAILVTEVPSAASYYNQKSAFGIGALPDLAAAAPAPPAPLTPLELPDATSADTIHHVQYGNQGKAERCAVVYGKANARCTVLHGYDLHPLFSAGQGALNETFWSPNGRVVVVGGYGACDGRTFLYTVAGKKMFYDSFKTTTFRDTTSHGFVADSRGMVVATTHPRLRVDNHFSLVTLDGDVYYREEAPVLTFVVPSPAVDGTTDRPVTPARLERAAQVVNEAKEKSATTKRTFGTGSGRVFGASAVVKTEAVSLINTETSGLSAAAKRRLRQKKNAGKI